MLARIFQILFCAALLALNPQTMPAAQRSPDGRKIFLKQCAKCHGRNGEGVKGKYDDALSGDRSLEKLASYIDKKMPEDAPHKCVGADADVVARYIYDAFYSREARERNHPARVELVRLTNRQYANAIADLLAHFVSTNGPIGDERGLRAIYFNSQNLGEKKFLERIDRTIDFDFSASRPPIEGLGTNGFSMQWRGSIIAGETGDYEFILKTPNGAKLWVNNRDEPIIDASVVSGDFTEYKATVRLLDGRAYPIHLDYFKSVQKTASVELWWKPPHGTAQLIPARNFSPVRTTQTFVVTTPFPPDDSSVGYERGVSVSKAWDEATTHAAIDVANYVVDHLDQFSQSKASDKDRAAKVEKFCNEFAAVAFRRPLSAEQKKLFITSQFKRAKMMDDAVKRIVLLVLKSPEFLYLGIENQRPNDFAAAERLSFALWDSLPNRGLSKLAESNELHTREQVARQAKAMLKDPRAHAKVRYFFQQWLQMNRKEDVSKDAKIFPGFSPEIISDLRTSLNLFLDDVVWSEASDYRKLLRADYLFLNIRLAPFYGVSTNAADDFFKVNFDNERRCGVLTHPYLLATFSYQKSTSPIHRGVFLTRNIVGRALKPPPMAQIFKDSDFAPNLTMREKVSGLTKSESCQGCHSVINPLGFSLENYDAVGRFRTTENEKPIDPVSEYVADDGQTVRLGGARDVAEFAINSEQAQNGFIEQLFHQVVKQPMAAYGSEVMPHLRQSFVASEFNLQKLIVEIATVSALHNLERKNFEQKLTKGTK